MLNTQMTDKGILVTDDNGAEIGIIERSSNGLWVAVPDPLFDVKYDMGIKAFRSLSAAEYYMLAVYEELKVG